MIYGISILMNKFEGRNFDVCSLTGMNVNDFKIASLTSQVESKLSALSCSLKETEEGRQEVQSQLEQTSEQLLQVQAQLQLAEQVLEFTSSQ